MQDNLWQNLKTSLWIYYGGLKFYTFYDPTLTETVMIITDDQILLPAILDSDVYNLDLFSFRFIVCEVIRCRWSLVMGTEPKHICKTKTPVQINSPNIPSATLRHVSCAGVSWLPVVVGAVLALGGVGCNGVDDLLGVRVDQLDRVDGQVLIEVSPALGCVRTQVTLVLPLFCNRTHKHTHTRARTEQDLGLL